mmetsp:Transcript_9345/g.20672  ORF Transcript_9345/g.20672 Transcript_9345/m.20672 type:complete len:103 (-) Transcript_9345:240-548(-)|eukprot:CAMPEP_0113308698 /NCGR_PEP_ID=MMETSP0010_2-20120614/7043_1 /TAXON_ID=216773 ORGANISM="Corethron hystrix, Strain 308" /NCGR_SAMPLE_ID=MMETSP0010_2 /ASSEMBLY_ACC=CAM_ASM_000155 /LENGTH=102 /DNA_ID=CAMNT_0000163813 /DNA_START=218 /DNA_END=526 /DNA_ORIENTATION=+ /assembly_acc=CAM_ASM_000155
MTRNGIAKGKNSGHVTTKRIVSKPSRRVGAKSKRVGLVRSIVREVAGLSPYERRILDMIKAGGAAADKRVYKFAKRRLGSHKRALAKREDIKNINVQQRAKK